jgi:hypothetical protein
MLPTKNVQQQGAKAVYDTFRCDTSCQVRKSKWKSERVMLEVNCDVKITTLSLAAVKRCDLT